MQQKVLHGLILAVVLVLISGMSYLLGTQNPTTTDNEEDSEFTTYTSTALGFSMKIPKELPVLYRCEGSIEEKVPVKVIEDVEEKIAYIIPEHFYEDKGKTPFDPDIGYEPSGVCEKIVRTLADLKKETHNKLGTTFPWVGWTLAAHNKPDYPIEENSNGVQEYLTSFAQNMMGKECVESADMGGANVGNAPFNSWPRPDLYGYLHVQISEDQLPTEDSGPSFGEGCLGSPLGYRGLVKAGFEDGRLTIEGVAMVVSGHHDATFWVDINDGDKGSYDQDMLASFRFTD